MSLEGELKFRVARPKLGTLVRMRLAGAQLGRPKRQNLVSTYFDTPGQKFYRHKVSLRVRQSGRQYRQTIKTAAAGSFARGEWETEISGPNPDLDQIDETPLAPLATKKTRRKLKPVFRTSVRRITRALHTGSSEIELAIDRGRVTSGRRSQPIAEFELELKKGHAGDLFRIAGSFERRVAAELDLRSKSERGYRLARGDRQLAVRAEPIQLDSAMTAREAFDAIAYSTLRHFSGNADGVRALDAEAVHQMRVGLRRLRAAISLFSDILPGPSTEQIKQELKWLTNELAPAREMDVFVKEQIKPLGRTSEPKRGVRAIEKQFSARRRRAFRSARETLATPRYRRLLIDVLEWLELRKARDNDQASSPIGPCVAALMHRRVRKVRKAARDLEKLSPRARHKLRIRIKKIRYAVGFVESLYPDKAQDDLKRLSDHLKKIQSALGKLNDFIAHRALAANAALKAPPEHRRARAFASGLLVGQEQEASGKLLVAAAREMRRLRQLDVEPD